MEDIKFILLVGVDQTGSEDKHQRDEINCEWKFHMFLAALAAGSRDGDVGLSMAPSTTSVQTEMSQQLPHGLP